MINVHSQVNFKIAVDITDIYKGYFFLAVEHHLGLRIETIDGGIAEFTGRTQHIGHEGKFESMFLTDQFASVVESEVKHKVCQVFWLYDDVYGDPLNVVEQLNLQ